MAEIGAFELKDIKVFSWIDTSCKKQKKSYLAYKKVGMPE